MTDSYEEQLKNINNVGFVSTRIVNNIIKPLAKVANNLLHYAGKNVGFLLGRHREFRSDNFFIRDNKMDFFTRHIKVYYHDKLVLHFDNYFTHVGFTSQFEKGKHFFLYKEGGWEQALLDEYREFASRNLREEFGIKGLRCKRYDTITKGCRKYDDRPCPCEDYLED